jgi:uncharacterized membrane protein
VKIAGAGEMIDGLPAAVRCASSQVPAQITGLFRRDARLGATPAIPNVRRHIRRRGVDRLEQPHGSICMEARMARNSARSFRGEPGDRTAEITRRVPSTSRIQSSSVAPGAV